MGVESSRAFIRFSGKDETGKDESQAQKEVRARIKIEQTANLLRNHEGALDTDIDPNYEAKGFVVFNEERISDVQDKIRQMEGQFAEWENLSKERSLKNFSQLLVDEIKSFSGELLRNFGSAKGEQLAKLGGAEISKQMKELKAQLNSLHTQLDRVIHEADDAISGAKTAKMELKQLLITYFDRHSDGEVN